MISFFAGKKKTTPISLASKPQKVLGYPGKMIPVGIEKNVWKRNWGM